MRTAESQRSHLRIHFWIGIALLFAGVLLIFGRTSANFLFLHLPDRPDYPGIMVPYPGAEFMRPLSDYWFAAIWFGYILVLDAIIYWRDGRSLIVNQSAVFLAMLPLSAAGWWGFEWLNGFVMNWHYYRPADIPDWYANIWSAVFFSTVIPAVWETADWIGGTRLLTSLRRARGFALPSWLPWVLMLLGVVSFVLPVVFPRYFFPLIWGFAALVLDPLNYMRGLPSILGHWARGQWRVPLAFYLGGMACGPLWEFWNYWAFPKWYYTIPYVGFGRVFEMPILGYIGYGPFAWELFALFWFVAGFVLKPSYADDFALPKEARRGEEVMLVSR